jgi:hypothetical protein
MFKQKLLRIWPFAVPERSEKMLYDARVMAAHGDEGPIEVTVSVGTTTLDMLRQTLRQNIFCRWERGCGKLVLLTQSKMHLSQNVPVII